MASQVTGYAGKYDPGNGTQYSLGSTAFAICETAANVAAKTADMTGFVLMNGATIHVQFINDNIVEAPTLNINSTGAFAIKNYDNVVNSNIWKANTVISFTFKGVYESNSWTGEWIRDYASIIQKGYNEITNVPIASFNDGEDGARVKKLVININPVQEGSGDPAPIGKNKLNASTMIVGAYIDENGVITTLDNAKYSELIPVTTGSWVFDSGNNTTTGAGSQGNYRVHAYDSNGNWIQQIGFQRISSGDGDYLNIVFTVSSNVKFVRVSTPSAAINLQLEQGNAATSYEAYSGNIRPISGWTGASISRTGKNLLNPSLFLYTTEFSGVFTNSNTLANGVLNGADNLSTGGQFFRAGTYTFSYKPVSGPTWNRVLARYSDGTTERVLTPAASGDYVEGTFTLEQDAYILIRHSGTGTSVFTEPQIEVGSSRTAYVPFIGTVYSASWQSEAGTVYGGTLRDNGDGTWALVNLRFMLTLDGTEAFSELGTVGTDHRFRLTNSAAGVPVVLYNSTQKSSHFVWSESNGEFGTFRISATNLIIPDSAGLYTLDSFKAWLAAQYSAGTPVQIMAVLASPVSYTLTAESVRALLGQNNIFADCGDINTLQYYPNNAPVFHDELTSQVTRLENDYVKKSGDTMTGTLQPGTTKVYNLGATDKLWNNIYAQNYIVRPPTSTSGGSALGFRVEDSSGNKQVSIYYNTAGTSSACGIAGLTAGNNLDSGTTGKARGTIWLYGPEKSLTRIMSSTVNTGGVGYSSYMYFPNFNGTGYLTHVASESATGSASQPVYVAANGRITAITGTINNNAATASAVTQNATTNSNVDYRILLSTTATNRAETGALNKNNNLFYNPYTNKLYINNGGSLASTGTLTINSGSTLYLNHASNTSLIFRQNGIEYARFSQYGCLILGTPASPNGIAQRLYVDGKVLFNIPNGTTSAQDVIIRGRTFSNVVSELVLADSAVQANNANPSGFDTGNTLFLQYNQGGVHIGSSALNSSAKLKVFGSIEATTALNVGGNLSVTGNTTLSNTTTADNLTAGTLMVTGAANFTQIPTAPTATDNTNDTRLATTEFVHNAFRTNDAMVFKGVVNAASDLPATHLQGWTYKVGTAGTYAGQVCEIGDTIYCVTDGTAANNDHWIVVQNNIDILPIARGGTGATTRVGAFNAIVAPGGTMTGGLTFTTSSTTSAYNDLGIKFSFGSRISESSAGLLGIYGDHSIVIRPESGTTSSGDGIEINSNGVIPTNNNSELLGDSTHIWNCIHTSNLDIRETNILAGTVANGINFYNSTDNTQLVHIGVNSNSTSTNSYGAMNISGKRHISFYPYGLTDTYKAIVFDQISTTHPLIRPNDNTGIGYIGSTDYRWYGFYGYILNLAATNNATNSSTTTASIYTAGGIAAAKAVAAKSIKIDNNSTTSNVELQYDATLGVLNFVFS